MSIVAALDLGVPPSGTSQPSPTPSPRAICVVPSPWSPSSDAVAGQKAPNHNQSRNPFDGPAASSSSSSASFSIPSASTASTVGLVYGTDAGTLHYRAYASAPFFVPPTPSRGGGGSGPSTATTGAAPPPSQRHHSQSLQVPLGVATPTTRPSPHLPRWLFPVDHSLGLAAHAKTAGTDEPPSVVACLPLLLMRGDSPHGIHPSHGSTVAATWRADAISSSSRRGWGAGHPTSIGGPSALAGTPLLVLVDDRRVGGDKAGGETAAPSSSGNGAYGAHLRTLPAGGGAIQAPAPSQGSQAQELPRMSCAALASDGSIVYAAGRTLSILLLAATSDPGNEPQGQSLAHSQRRRLNQSSPNPPPLSLTATSVALLPAPGVRAGSHALAVASTTTSSGQVAVVAVGNAFYAVNLSAASADALQFNHANPQHPRSGGGARHFSFSSTYSVTAAASASLTTKIATLAQSYSQVHPVIALDLEDPTLDDDWASVLVANGRECAIVDLCVSPDSAGEPTETPFSSDGPSHTSSSPSALAPLARLRGGALATVTSPILAATAAHATSATTKTSPWIALLTSDGLVSLRSPLCLSVVLRHVEVGRPNDYFDVLWLPSPPSEPQSATTTSAYVSGGLGSAPSTASQRSLPSSATSSASSWLLAASHSGEATVIVCPPDSSQDQADRLLRLAVDAFGSNGFPRVEAAEALGCGFASSSYSGAAGTTGNSASPPEAAHAPARALLQQYLEAALGLTDWESGAASGWPTAAEAFTTGGDHPASTMDYRNEASVPSSRTGRPPLPGNRSTALPVLSSSSSSPASLLTATALLCLVCIQVTPPQSDLANRAARACSDQLGVVPPPSGAADVSGQGDALGGFSLTEMPGWVAAARACELTVEKILRDAGSLVVSLLSGSSPAPIVLARGHRTSQSVTYVEFVECCVWLLRACGNHGRALDLAYERLQRQQQPPPAYPPSGVDPSSAAAAAGAGGTVARGVWSLLKYETHTAAHLSELWASGGDAACQLVLQSSATHRLIENNPRLGLSIFCGTHPRNAAEWHNLRARDDPLASPERVQRVLKLLLSIRPALPYPTTKIHAPSTDPSAFPLDSGRALAVSYLESAIGIETGRTADSEEFDSLPPDRDLEERMSDFHDELSLLLLEGVVAERRPDDQSGKDSDLGGLYRSKLRRFLQWPLAKIRGDQFTAMLPPSFLHEQALMLGRSGNHEDALRILYHVLGSVDLALEYCDARHEQLKAQQDRVRARQQHQQQQRGMFDDYQVFESVPIEDNAYLPLIKVALDSDDVERGTAAAIQVLALRRNSVDRAAALRLLPSDVPVSAVARPFLIPALVDSESHVRRLTVVSCLLRARFVRLKDQLTAAQLKAQAFLHVVPQLQSLKLGDPLHSTNPFRARTSSQGGGSASTMPDVMIVKHFFPRHLVIQARVTNSVGLNARYARTLSDVAFVVAESSEEAIQPLLQVPILRLPPKLSGSAWCVLSAAPSRMDGPTAQLTCELRYTVQSVEASAALGGGGGLPAGMGSPGAMSGRTYVEELQDLEVHAAHFS